MGAAVTIQGNIKVTVRGSEHAADKIAAWMVANSFTAAQYSSGLAACEKRARGVALTAQEIVFADRFTAMQAAVGGLIFKVEAV